MHKLYSLDLALAADVFPVEPRTFWSQNDVQGTFILEYAMQFKDRRPENVGNEGF
jgi:hypothetical protein